MIQSRWERFKIYYHRFRKNHRIEHGYQHGYGRIWCSCGYYKPRVNRRDGDEAWAEKKHLTPPEAQRLIDGLRK